MTSQADVTRSDVELLASLELRHVELEEIASETRHDLLVVVWRPVRVQTLAVPPRTMPVAAHAHVPVLRAVGHLALVAESCVVVKSSTVDRLEAQRFTKSGTVQGGPPSGDVVTQTIAASDALKDETPRGRVAMLVERVL
jgi:hypothetical protein